MPASIPVQPLCLRHDLGDAIKDRYIVRDILGSGAFGTVYRVEEALGSRVVVRACKEMHVLDDPETGGDERADALRMFQEEAYLLETLRNAHLPSAHFEPEKGVWLACPVCGRTFKGARHCPDHGAELQVVKERYYLLMDFIEGPDLEQMLESNNGKPLEEIPVLDWSLQVCDALQVVHAAGFSHRDIKPANIKIQNSTQQAMLIDFGLVKPSSVVGSYGTVLQRRSTSMGTLGYAPPSPQEQQRPDARTDILALGMTLYRLLTTRDPTEPADLEAMRKGTPRGFNPKLSPEINDLILKAIRPDPNQRYADVAALRADLQAARYPISTTCPHCGQVQHSAQRPDAQAKCERCGRPLQTPSAPAQTKATRAVAPTTPIAPKAKPDPNEARLNLLRDALSERFTPSGTRFDARIREVEALLAPVAKLATGVPADLCPACQQAKLTLVDGKPNGMCPLCLRAQLARRDINLARCPVCRHPDLYDAKLDAKQLFCPVCREMPLEVEKRNAYLGLVADLWWKCPHCRAQFDEQGKQAQLKEVESDPFGVGAINKNRTLSFDEWKKLSLRKEDFCACRHCSANYEEPTVDTLTLMHFTTDPFGAGEKWKGVTMTRDEWAKIAADLPLEAGTHGCPSCGGEFDVDATRRVMTLRKFGAVAPDWAQGWQGRPIDLPAWYVAAAGKTDGRPGAICPHCHTEWDSDGDKYRLFLAHPGPLSGSVGASYTLEDWQRRARSAPTREEAAHLRQELASLQSQRDQESAGQQRIWSLSRAAQEEELARLYKQSVLGGFVPLQRMGANKAQSGTYVALPVNALHAPLRPNEMLRWESPANRCMPVGGGWAREVSGSLVVTHDRLLFVSQANANPFADVQGMGLLQILLSVPQPPRGGPDLWQRTHSKMQSVNLQMIAGVPLVVIKYADMDLPIGFEVNNYNWQLCIEGQTRPLTITPHDLESLLHSLS